MLDLDQIVTLLKDRNLSEVSRRTKLNYLTVWKIANGFGTRASYYTIKCISDYLEETMVIK